MHVPPNVQFMCWFLFDRKYVAVNKLISVWSSNDLIYARYCRWRFCQQNWLFQAWRNNSKWQSGNNAGVTITAAATCEVSAQDGDDKILYVTN